MSKIKFPSGEFPDAAIIINKDTNENVDDEASPEEESAEEHFEEEIDIMRMDEAL